MKKLFSLLLLSGVFHLLSCHEKTPTREISSPGGNSAIREVTADFERTLSNYLAIKHGGSFSAAIVRKDEIIWSKTFGKADNQKSINADTSTIYRIGSISKTVTAYLLLVMVQNGVLKLDDPVANYLPEIKKVKQNGTNAGGDITFRQLADHTSGLAREPNLADATVGPVEAWESKVITSIPATMLTLPVGKTYSYSNIGYAILGLAISRAAHRPFTDLVEDLVFRPHGMANSFYKIPMRLEHRVAVGYTWNSLSMSYDSRQSEKELAGRGYKVPNGGVFTTANELARFLICLTADTDRLSRNYREQMQTIQTAENKNEGYGLGLMITNHTGGIKMVGHGGLVAGFSSYMVFDPASRMGVVLLSNCEDASVMVEIQGKLLLNKLVRADKETVQGQP